MRKKVTFSIIAVIIVSSLIISYIFFAFPLRLPSRPPSINWTYNLDNFATAIAFDNGRVFVTDNPGNVVCVDAHSGDVIWTASVGGWTANAHLIAISDGVVYVGAAGGVVNTIDEASGKLLPPSFAAPVTTSWGFKQSPQQFFISDGRIFVEQNGWAVFDVSSGDLFWKSGELGLTVGNASYSHANINPIFVQRTIRFNPNNGSIIWQVSGDASDPAVIAQDKVILWNYNPNGTADNGQIIICVNASTGKIIWQFDVESKMYQPTEYDGLVLFGAYDGNFYALRLSDGTLAWKTKVTDQNSVESKPSGLENYPLTPAVSLVQINEENNKAFWAFTFAQNGWGGTDQYSGVICSLDLASGHISWKTQISQDTSISSSGNIPSAQLGLKLLIEKVFLTSGSDLLVIDQSTGSLEGTQHFEHYVLSPVAGKEQVFVAGDLDLFAFK